MSSESTRVTEELNHLQNRGTVKGADAVFEDAWDEATTKTKSGSAVDSRQSFWLVAAGLLTLLVGGTALYAVSGEEVDDSTVTAPAACTVLVDQSTGLANSAQGALVDDPVSMLCPVEQVSDARTLRDLEVTTFGDVEARVVEVDNGQRSPWWVAEVIPFPAETGALPADPASKAGGVVFPLDDQARFDAGVLRIKTELATGHADHVDGSSGEGHWVIVTRESDEHLVTSMASSAPDVFIQEYSLFCNITGGSSGRVAGCGLVNPSGELEWTATFFTDDLPSPPEGGVDSNGTIFTQCASSDAAADCLDQVTFEFSETSLTILVNGEQFFRQADLPPLPAELLEADLSVWWAVGTIHSEINQIRYHGATLTG